MMLCSASTVQEQDSSPGQQDIVTDQDSTPGQQETVTDQDSTSTEQSIPTSGQRKRRREQQDIVTDQDSTPGQQDTVTDQDSTTTEQTIPTSGQRKRKSGVSQVRNTHTHSRSRLATHHHLPQNNPSPTQSTPFLPFFAPPYPLTTCPPMATAPPTHPGMLSNVVFLSNLPTIHSSVSNQNLWWVTVVCV